MRNITMEIMMVAGVDSLVLELSVIRKRKKKERKREIRVNVDDDKKRRGNISYHVTLVVVVFIS